MGMFFDSNYIKMINELYVGETQFITDLIDEVSKARAPYVGKLKRPIKGNKDFIKIGDMIAKEFGFYAVTFNVPYDVSTNAFTYPITMAIDQTVIGVKPKFYKDRGLRYNPETSKLCILVAVTAGVWFNPEFSDREVVAAILHEIGHSFALQSKNLVDIIEANRVSLAFNIIYSIMIKLFAALKNPAVLATLPSDIKQIMNASNKGKEIINVVSKELAENPLFKPFNGISAITEWVSGIFTGLFREMMSILSGPLTILSIPIAALNNILMQFNITAIASGRSQEFLSDSFATMYGMGPEISTFLTKIEFSSKSSGSKIDRILYSIPVIGALRQTLGIPVLLLNNSINTHPSTPARINKILDELNKELKDSDLDPKTKEELKKNIKSLEKIKNDCMAPLDKKKYNGEMVKRMWVAFLFNKGDSSNKYENNYTNLKKRDKYVRESVESIDDIINEFIKEI